MEKKEDGGLYFMNKIWVPLVGDVRTLFMDEAHASRYLVHPRADKTYYDLRDMYGGHKAVGTRLDMSTTYYPQTDGQSERTIQTLEDMLRACVIEFGGSWDTHFFSQAKIGENWLIGPELVQETTDKVILIKERLKVAKDCQNSYVGNMRKQLGFEVGDKVILEVSSWKGVKYLADVNLRMPVEEIKVDKTLRFVEEPVEIIDREVKSLKRSRILIVKVHWNSKRGHEDFMKTSIHACSMSNLLLEVLIKVGYIGLLADFSAPLNVLRWLVKVIY
ncbi:putative reverse transcriptase domain-containing protein [Tanacetum coccineum]|uniref:Reverse transcriptase domain-containing protein n=1 Tax=Tanacetum coccineum TaxID=301880 RepID=A0ABQ5DW30_9ASTR